MMEKPLVLPHFNINNNSEQGIKKTPWWVKLYESIGVAGVVCMRCGISRPTLRKRIKRYKEFGIDGLNEHSRRPQKYTLR
jgi:transcriptional regulator with AAA-type ATPase domain